MTKFIFLHYWRLHDQEQFSYHLRPLSLAAGGSLLTVSSHGFSFVRKHPGISFCVQISSYKDTSQIRLGSTLMDSV